MTGGANDPSRVTGGRVATAVAARAGGVGNLAHTSDGRLGPDRQGTVAVL